MIRIGRRGQVSAGPSLIPQSHSTEYSVQYSLFLLSTSSTHPHSLEQPFSSISSLGPYFRIKMTIP